VHEVSAEDLAIIREHGIPIEPGPEFLTIGPDRSVTFTDRGRRLYRLAMLLHGLSPDPVDEVRDVDGLRDLSLKVKRARLMFEREQVERALRGGKIPAKSREMVQAALYGTPEELQAAVERRLACEEAGPNVIPVRFGSKRRDQMQKGKDCDEPSQSE